MLFDLIIINDIYSERNALHKSMEKVVQEMQDAKDKCEELRGAKQVLDYSMIFLRKNKNLRF